MSYKSLILSDYPLSYNPLDDITTGVVPDFNEILAQFNTYQDVLDYYASYANMTGSLAYDYSGCNNHGTYSGAPEVGILPLVVGNSMATKVTDTEYINYNILNDYTGKAYDDHFGTKYSSSDNFTIECWIYPKITSSTLTPIVADATNNVGIFYQKGNITFNVDTESVSYTLMDIGRVFHIAATYTQNDISIYVDGKLAATKVLSEFVFTNEQCNLKSGPTDTGDYFHINSVATYRYALTESKILSHYNAAKGIVPIQIVAPENGELFQVYENTPSLKYKYSYPGNKNWDYFTTADLAYNSGDNYLYMIPVSTGGSKTIEINDYISFPLSDAFDSSKIEWTATPGVTVSTSIDGTNYDECVNGDPIPGYRIGNFSTNSQLHIKITMTTTDASKYIPRIKDLTVCIYENQILYADNSASTITTLEGVSGVTVADLAFGNSYSEILWRGDRNGVKSIQNSGFNVTTAKEIQTVEFFYTPSSLGDDSGLVETLDGDGYLASVYKWNGSGGITKTGISAIYVNGINKYSETHIENVFKAGELHHVVIVYTDLVSGVLRFNYTTYGSVPSVFQNIALYNSEFNLAKAKQLYELYIYGSYSIVDADSSASISMTENSVSYYNNDWRVIQTI